MRILIGLAALALAAPASAEKVVVTADRMVDVLTGKMVEHPAVFVGDDGRITSVADARTVRWGADVRHINLSGKTILPGLIDMHVHLDSPADIGGYRGLEYTDSFWGMTAVGNARAMLDAGFTTVRNVGSDERNDVGLKQAIDDGYASARGSFPPAMRSARPAVIAILPSFRRAWRNRIRKKALAMAWRICVTRSAVSASSVRK